MGKYIINGETMTAIADAIREKTGGFTQLTPAEMVDAILGIKSRIEFTRDGSGNIVGVSLYGLSEVPEEAFCDYKTLQWVDFTNSPGISKIGKRAFYGCTALKSIDFPNTITEIGQKAFAGASLQSVTLPETIESIGMGAFGNCAALTNVEIRCNLNSGERIFVSCKGLEKAWIRSTCNIISGTTTMSAPFFNAGKSDVFRIYVEHQTKPSGFSKYFRYKTASADHKVTYGVTERPW